MRPLNKNIKVKIDYPNILTSDVYRINFEHFGLTIGYIEFSEIFNGQDDDDLTEEEYDELFPDDKYVYILQVYVDRNWRGKGIANNLINKFFEFCEDEFPDNLEFALNASPMELSIPLNYLIRFYETFGFEPIPKLSYPDNCTMIKSNRKLINNN